MLDRLRTIELQEQGLMKSDTFGQGEEGVQKSIEHLGYIQIDSISVVERAHHHTLWNRVSDYRHEYLATLVQNKAIFEYWFHAAAYLPMSHYRFATIQMQRVRDGKIRSAPKADADTMRYVLDRIRIEGPLRSREFKDDTANHSKWWDGKPAKKALERLFFQGNLMVVGRQGIEKTYDLTERVVPGTVNTKMPSLQELAEYLIDTTIRAHGFATLSQILHLRTGKALKNATIEVLNEKIESGKIECHKFEDSLNVYISQSAIKKALQPQNNEVVILSPFDNATICTEMVIA